MYLRRTPRRASDGGAVGYLQLAHNVWDRESRQSRVRVIHSFGREDELDRTAIVRLIGSLERVLEPGEALEARADSELRFVESRPMGGALMLDGLWHRLGIDTVMAGLLEGRRLDAGAERVLFALVANRALEPFSKLAATGWVRERAWIDGLDDVTDDACYRAMDWLWEIEEQLCERVYRQPADLLNLKVDLLFFDTTSTYFETDRADEQQVDEDGVATPAFGSYGHSKDHRLDLPQVRIGMAVTARGSRSGCGAGPATKASRSSARLARPEDHPGPAPRPSPPRRPHPRARLALLARAAADPHRRARDRRHLAQRPQRATTPASRHVHRPRRHLPTTHRAHGPPTRPACAPSSSRSPAASRA